MGFLERLIGEEPSLWSQFWNYDNPGSFGEYMTGFALDSIAGYGKILRNIYIPYKNRTSEIDVLLIHEKGLFVFESKNYSGWIFGNAESSKWTQCLPSKEKHSFYNPIFQNRTHLKALSQYLQCNTQSCHSYIIFSERCTLKSVPENTDEYIIVKRPDMLASLKQNIKGREIVFSTAEVDELENKLVRLTYRSSEEKEQHIQNIKSTLTKLPQHPSLIADAVSEPPLCPTCKVAMILRTASRGVRAGKKFCGCPNYPKCRSVINVNE